MKTLNKLTLKQLKPVALPRCSSKMTVGKRFKHLQGALNNPALQPSRFNSTPGKLKLPKSV